VVIDHKNAVCGDGWQPWWLRFPDFAFALKIELIVLVRVVIIRLKCVFRIQNNVDVKALWVSARRSSMMCS
jgi:hypothetical protein